MLQSGLEIIKEENRLNGRNTSNNNTFEIRKKEKVKKICRICLCDEAETKDKDDPIVMACNCKGSSGYIHLKCLQEWLNTRRKKTKLSAFQENYIYKKS